MNDGDHPVGFICVFLENGARKPGLVTARDGGLLFWVGEPVFTSKTGSSETVSTTSHPIPWMDESPEASKGKPGSRLSEPEDKFRLLPLLHLRDHGRSSLRAKIPFS